MPLETFHYRGKGKNSYLTGLVFCWSRVHAKGANYLMLLSCTYVGAEGSLLVQCQWEAHGGRREAETQA